MAASSCKFPPTQGHWVSRNVTPLSRRREERRRAETEKDEVKWVVQFSRFVCCRGDAIINGCRSAWGREFSNGLWGKKVLWELRSGRMFAVKWQQRSGAFMHRKQATVFLHWTCKLFSSHGDRNTPTECIFCGDMSKCFGRTTLQFILARCCLCCYFIVFPRWFNELKWDETRPFPQERTKSLLSGITGLKALDQEEGGRKKRVHSHQSCFFNIYETDCVSVWNSGCVWS